MNVACNDKKFFGPALWGPEEGSKGQISFNFNYKVNFKDFKNFSEGICDVAHRLRILVIILN